MASTSAFFVSRPVTSQPKDLAVRCCISPTTSSAQYGINIRSSHFLIYSSKQRSFRTMCQASTVAAPPVEETKECSLPTWAEFELGRSPVCWKTMNGLPPTSEEDLTLFYNPAASKLTLTMSMELHSMGDLISQSCVVVSQG